jgi:Uma2 family endonuclease
MNVHVTRALDGFPRRRFTVADCLRMEAAGIIGPDERYELIEGEIRPLSPKHHAHERIKLALNRALARYLPDSLQLGVETSVYLADDTFVDPDLSVFPIEIPTEEVRAADMLLAIEVAATSLRFDKGPKAKLYARHGLGELWVIDAATGVTFIHTGPGPRGYGRIDEVAPDAELASPSLPGFSFRIAGVP